ncbi:MAG: hypothetical protein KME23_02285 [Goleter apudmare HA4340-LM2]|jgi:TM2 domain-containing membrane protein YozV|nr:hypothetical protein [Goleter apudmare HA4340-LM2]
MNVLGIIVNIFLPGIGTLIVGKIPQGIIQIILIVIAIILNLTVIFAILGIPIAIGTWIWALVSAATPKKPPTQRFRE